MAFDPRSLFGMDCIRCGNDLIAPENSEYLDYQLIRHVWHCPMCHAVSKPSLDFRLVPGG